MSVRLSLRREEAAEALGISPDLFDKRVRPELPVVRVGTVNVWAVAAIEAWLEENSHRILEDVA